MDKTVVIIPAYNEQLSMQTVIDQLKKVGLNKIIVSLDSRSTDTTSQILKKNKIHIVKVAEPGYDPALELGVKAIKKYYPSVNYVLFADAGNKYGFNIVKKFIKKIENGADMVLGTRVDFVHGLHWHQKLGTQLVLVPIKLFFNKKIKDISPFRLIRYDVLKSLKMKPKKFRWTTEMLIKCLALNLNVAEVDVKTQKRIGKSKISGNLKNSLLAGVDMFSALKYINYKTEDVLVYKTSLQENK